MCCLIKKPKCVVDLITEELGGELEARSVGVLPRNHSQISDIKRKAPKHKIYFTAM